MSGKHIPSSKAANVFFCKAHIGVDKDTVPVHHVKATAANMHDTEAAKDLIHGDEDELDGDDSGYLNVEDHISEDKQKRAESTISTIAEAWKRSRNQTIN